MENIRSIMRECMRIDKPLVTIALAVYRPNYKWFAELLESLNNQIYENIELIIWDDCPDAPIDICFVERYITNFPIKLYTSPENLGSNYAFERLTELADGKYISYCDQDDIWEKNKVSEMVSIMEQEDCELVYSDLSVIDAQSHLICDSIRKIRKRVNYVSGVHVAGAFLIRNCVAGCAMLIKADIAKDAIPFEKEYVHDQWLSLMAASKGRIFFINKPLIRYRQHGQNQTGVLTDASSKRDYYLNRIVKLEKGIKKAGNRIKMDDRTEIVYRELCMFMNIRRRYFNNPSFKLFRKLLKYRKYGAHTVLFEIFLPFMPEKVFELAVKIIKNGII